MISKIERELLLIITLQYDQNRGMHSRSAGDKCLFTLVLATESENLGYTYS